MKKHARPEERAAFCYTLLLSLYPKEHRQAFGAQMLRTFRDQHHDLLEQRGKTGVAYWLAIIGDEAKSVAKERFVRPSVRHQFANLLLFGTILLVASSFFWLNGFIVSIKIPAILLLLAAFAVTQSRRRQPVALPGLKRVWRREGLRNGVILGLIWTVLHLLGNLYPNGSAQQNAAKLLVVGILLLGMPLLFGLAGFFGGRGSGSIMDGTFAGILAAIVSSIISVLSVVVILLLFWSTVRDNAFQSAEMIRAWHASGDPSFGRYLWLDNLSGALAYTLISLVFGLLLGTLGGALGASLSGGKRVVARANLAAGDGLA